MTFTSFAYILFLPLTFGITFSLPARARTGWLVIASYLFYMYWKPEYALVILGMTVVDYFAGILIERRPSFYFVSLASNLGILFVFKYMGFFAHELKFAFPDLLLPIGLSFHTLQSIGYVTDVYRGVQKSERDFLRFALFIAWFPQMVAGPIERASTLLPQLRDVRLPDRASLKSALGLILWGVIKKTVVADNVGSLVDAFYAQPGAFPRGQAIGAVFLFGLQIYCDFSGYTDIARGSSRLFSIRLTPNFDRPLTSASLVEFWKRWHISLSRWFFEYVYFPLARRSAPLAVFAVFLLSGLWHGANWTFLLWGLCHALAYIISLEFRIGSKFFGWLSTIVTVCLLWIFFRAPSLGTAWDIFGRLVRGDAGINSAHQDLLSLNFFIALAIGLLVLVAEEMWAIQPRFAKAARRHMLVLAGLGVLIVLTIGAFSGERFIYFQF